MEGDESAKWRNRKGDSLKWCVSARSCSFSQIRKKDRRKSCSWEETEGWTGRTGGPKTTRTHKPTLARRHFETLKPKECDFFRVLCGRAAVPPRLAAPAGLRERKHPARRIRHDQSMAAGEKSERGTDVIKSQTTGLQRRRCGLQKLRQVGRMGGWGERSLEL